MEELIESLIELIKTRKQHIKIVKQFLLLLQMIKI